MCSLDIVSFKPNGPEFQFPPGPLTSYMTAYFSTLSFSTYEQYLFQRVVEDEMEEFK